MAEGLRLLPIIPIGIVLFVRSYTLHFGGTHNLCCAVYTFHTLVMAAEGYQQSSRDVQMESGKLFLQTDVNPQPGDAILDLGCGTGELSAYLAELVEPDGFVVGVDPDVKRLNLAKDTHRDIKNLCFVEGNSDNFDGMGCEKYDLIFLNHVLHWIPNQQQAFKNMFSSLKEGGKIAIRYIDRIPPYIVTAVEVLIPETEEQLKKLSRSVDKVSVDRMCVAEGFEIVKSCYVNDEKLEFESVEVYLKWLWSSTHGSFDLNLVTEERIQRFLSRVGNPPFDFTSEDVNIRLIAVKPKGQADVHNEGAE